MTERAADTSADAGEGGTAAPPETNERNRAPDLTREYRGNDITVRWYAKRCIHSADCIRNAPRAFDPRRRPWINLEADTRERVIAAVEACPTGALEYVSLGPRDPTPTEIKMVNGGPLLLRGEVRIVDEHGNLLREANRVALCRCGKSRNMPFCDNSHRSEL